MNQAAQEYWKNQNQSQSVSAWQFGADPDYLAQLVIDGSKTATCSGYVFYELENEPLPTSEDYSIILNRDDKPVAIIKTLEVTLTPMNEVTRSEEHTSELQSHSHLVCRLLLEKKNTNQQT